ncbi:diguanylate cyclase [Kribbella sandramycini]|uniref:GGDEF domain-containing protein n=1 Tax=Kribbella sandramycini TaxID=60450 RepID=UPI00307EEBA6
MIAERIRRRVEGLAIEVDTPNGKAQLTNLTCSVGTGGYPNHGDTLDAVLLAADTATYQAKNSGRNRVVIA